MIAAMSMSGCADSTPSVTETQSTICRELQKVLPTYSGRDTEQTKEEGVRFLTVFGAVCHPGA